jgi:hypothetical protein
MLLHAESIQKFLDPCTHWIVINEKEPDVNAWLEILKPYYTKHKLNVIPRSYFSQEKEFSNMHGQISQQACKFLVSKFIQKNYLILDTKNFFIRKCNLFEYHKIIGSGIIEFVSRPPDDWDKFQPWFKGDHEMWSETVKEYARVFNLSTVPNYYLAPKTPFVMDYDLLCKRINLETFLRDFSYKPNGDQIYSPSEFIFYSMAVNDFIKPGVNTISRSEEMDSYTLMPHNFEYHSKELLSEEHFTMLNTIGENIKIYGIHRKFLRKCGPEHIKILNKWLASMDFAFRYR